MKRIAALLLIGAFGCTTALTAAGQKVQVATGAPGEGCQAVGDVHGVGESGTLEANVENARNDLRNKAAELGGNVVVIQTNNQMGARVDLMGVAFKCPGAEAPPPAQ